MSNRIYSRERGFILVTIMLLTAFVFVVSLATSQLAVNNLRAANLESFRVNAQFAADAGADMAMYDINQGLVSGTEWFGTGGTEITVADEASYKTTYKATVTNQTINGLSRKVLKVTGKTYSPKTSTPAVSSRTYTMLARPVEAGDFSVVTGVGGLVMQNSSKIIGGSVFVNGTITMTGSSQIGLTNSPVDVSVAHQSCPIGGGAGYPTQCSSGNGQPISISNPAWIYGEVKAQNQTNGSRMSNTGLVANSTVAPLALPTHDRAAQKSAINVANNLTGASASCTTNGGTKTWNANTKITGNVTVNKTCTVTVLGDVWITGDVSMSQSGTIKPSNILVTPPVIMVDGTVSLANSSAFASTTVSSPVGFRVITYKNSLNDPDVVPSGVDLFNSSSIETITLAQSSSGPNTEFYAKWSKVGIGNGGGVGAVTGQTIQLSNSASITFGAKVSGVPSIKGWVLESYRRDYTPL
ncbi:MAG: hypothetical protein ABIQ64_04440 [Candidatus Saccharimonadales bacterium]